MVLAGGSIAAKAGLSSEKKSADLLTAQNLLTVHTLIKPHDGEAPWSAIPWLTDVWEARRQAAREGKPIFAWLPAGEPLGCT
jgi:hypothetical protein